MRTAGCANMPRVTLDQINVICADPDASIAFYRRLGVEIPQTAIWRTPTGVQHVGTRDAAAASTIGLDLDSAAFAQHWNAGWSGRADLHGRVVIGFCVSSRAEVDDIYRDMTGAGYRGLQEPYDALWGARYAILADPDGIAVGLMSPVSPEKKSPPPDL